MLRPLPRIVGRTLGFCGVAAVLLTAALWIASLRWAFVLSGPEYVGRFYGGRLLYGSYETLHFPLTWPRVRVLRRVPGDYYGALCHEIQVSCNLAWFATPGAAASLLLIARRPRPGTCPACGYSLAGLPGACCPECGGSISRA